MERGYAMNKSSLSVRIIVLALAAALCAAAGAEAAWVDNHDGTVSDTLRGLMWQQEDGQNDEDNRNWEEALAYCEGLNLAGKGDWRLPNYRELASLVDYSRYHPAINPLFGCRSSFYWSSSTYVDRPDYAWHVHFHNGGVVPSLKGWNEYVRCVRSGPSGPFGPLTITQTPMSGPPGTTFVQWGTGFTPNSTATFHVKKPDGTEYDTWDQEIDASGHFEIPYTAPWDRPVGIYTWWAIDDTTGAKSNEISYEITAPVSLPLSVNTHRYNWASTLDQYSEAVKRYGFVRDGGWWRDLEAKDYKGNTAWQKVKWSYPFDLELANCDQKLTYSSGYDELVKMFQAADSPQLLLLLNATNSKLSADPNGITNAQYRDYVSRVVERYDGDGNNDMPGLDRPVEYFEIGNEVDCKKHTDDIPLTVENYVKTRLIPAYRAARAANPNAVVMNAGLSMECGSERGTQGFDLPYLDGMLSVIKKAGGAKNQYFMDALAIHYYNQIENPEYFDDNIRKVKALLAKYKIRSKPIWITEFGIATGDNANGKIREEDQASVLLRYLNLMAYHNITNPFVYSLKDLNSATPEDGENVFGLYRVDCEAGSEIIKEKLVVSVLTNYAVKTKGLKVKSINGSSQRKKGIFRITYSDGQRNLQVLWYSKRNGTGIDSEGHDLSTEKKNVKVSLGGRTGILSDMYGKVTNSSLADQSMVQLGEQPQYIEY